MYIALYINKRHSKLSNYPNLSNQSMDNLAKLHKEYADLWNQGITYRGIKDRLGISLNAAIFLRQKLKLSPRWESRYRSEGKIVTPLSDADFIKGMNVGYFVHPKHKGYCALLYYTGVRKTEGLRATKEQFSLQNNLVVFNVGKRLKHGKVTPALMVPYDAPFANFIWASVEHTAPGKRVFPYSPRTGYNIVHRAFKYPHLFRLSRITNFFLEGWTIAQVKNWTGLTLAALDYYVGLVDIAKMGESLNKFGVRKPAHPEALTP